MVGCRPASLLVATYNVMTMRQPGRLQDIVKVLSKYHVMGLQGTRVLTQEPIKCSTAMGMISMEAGYANCSGGNRHAGVALMLSKRIFQENMVKWVDAPAPAPLRGRGLAARVKSSFFDAMFMVLYFPL